MKTSAILIAGVLAAAAVLSAAESVPSFAAPTVNLAVDKNKLAVGDSANCTSQINTDAAVANLLWSMGIYPALQVTGVRGPAKVQSQASLDWTGGHAVSNVVTLRLSGVALSLQPDASGLLTVPIGDLAAGDTDNVVVTVKRIQ